MSTRSRIYLVLNAEDKGTTQKFELSKLPEGKKFNVGDRSLTSKEFYVGPEIAIPENANFISIYHHWDGYPEGVGQTLLTEFNDYAKILNLMLAGDYSTINGEEACAYNAWRGEDTEPLFETEQNPHNYEEYCYLFKEGSWYVLGDDIEDWTLVSEVLKENAEEETKA